MSPNDLAVSSFDTRNVGMKTKASSKVGPNQADTVSEQVLNSDSTKLQGEEIPKSETEIKAVSFLLLAPPLVSRHVSWYA